MENQPKRHPRARALFYWGGALVMLLGFLIGLTLLGGGDPEPAPAAGPVEATPGDISLDLDTEVVDDQIRIVGRTDLEDGAVLSYEVHQVDDARLEYRAAGHVEVAYGSFEETVGIGDWPSGDIEVYLAFPPVFGEVTQPAPIIERYGERGEALHGGNVRDHADGRILEQISVVHWRGREDRSEGIGLDEVADE